MSVRIVYMISANTKLAGKTYLSSHISVSELGKYISKLENTDSSGLDGVSYQLLKLSLPYVTDSLTYILNLCFDSCFSI